MITAILVSFAIVIELNMFLLYGELYKLILVIIASVLMIGFVGAIFKIMNIKSDDQIRNEYLLKTIAEQKYKREGMKAISILLHLFNVKDSSEKYNRMLQQQSFREDWK